MNEERRKEKKRPKGLVLALIKKEFLQIIRDPGTIMITFGLPLVLLFIFGYGVNLDNSRFHIGIVLEKSEPEAVSLLTAFSNSHYFQVQIGRDRRVFNDELVAGRLRGLVVIPADLAQSLNKGHSANIQVITDGSEPNIANFVQGYARGVINTWLIQRGQERGQSKKAAINVETRFRYNQELASRNFLLPGSLAIVMTLIGVILTALVIAREWERGTMEALMATPASIYQILLAKLIPYFILGHISMFMCWAAAVFWYEVPFRGSPVALILISSVFLLGALGQGLLISSMTRDQFLAAQAALVVGFLPAFILSGFIFEIASMPRVVQGLTLIFPARYFVSSLQTIFLAGDIWPLFLRSMAAMAVIGLVIFLLTAGKTRKRLD